MAAPRIIARGAGWEFWQIGGDVYRCAEGGVLDIYAFPASRRWECTIEHWRHYRAIYDWAVDVASGAQKEI